MGAEEIRIFTITDTWALIAGWHGAYVNNGNIDLYIQTKADSAPSADDLGVRIRPGGSFFVSNDIHKITYLRTASGTTTIAKYEDKNNGAGTSAIVDSATGNKLAVNADGSVNISMADADSGNTVTINELGQMHTVMRAATDASNSTSDLLLAGEKFTGEAVETLDYAEICVSVYSDVDSATDGLTIEFSPDGETWYSDGQSMSIYGTHGKTFSFQPERRYYRIDYQNGAEDQEHFNLETTLRKTRAKPSSHNINKAIALDDDAELTKSVLTASLDQTSTFVNIGANLAADGGYHLSVANIQNIWTDDSNSSTANLTSANSYSFTGTASTTLGASAIHCLLKTDRNAIIYIDQSSDGTEWDLTNSFEYFYSFGGAGFSAKTVGSHYRIRVELVDTNDTSFFRLMSKLTPISEPLPESLDARGRLKTSASIIDAENGTRAGVEPLGALKTISPVRLIGTMFNNGTKDPNFWAEAVTGSGSVSQAGQITLSTGTTANSSSKYSTVNKARKVAGATNQFRTVGRLVSDPQANNIRRIGPYDANNGYFFQVDGLTFGVGSRKNAVDTIVNSGSFNGNYGNAVEIGTTPYRLVIEYTSTAAYFFVNGILLHTVTNPVSAITNAYDFPITMENINSGGNTTDNSFQIRFATILRLGEITTNPIYRAIATNGTYILKYGSGVLQRIVNTDNAGSLLVYDNVSATGTLIATIDTAKALGTLEFNAAFSTGLTIVSSGGAKVTVIYE